MGIAQTPKWVNRSIRIISGLRRLLNSRDREQNLSVKKDWREAKRVMEKELVRYIESVADAVSKYEDSNLNPIRLALDLKERLTQANLKDLEVPLDKALDKAYYGDVKAVIEEKTIEVLPGYILEGERSF